MLLCPIVRQRANMSAKMTRSPIIVLLKCFVDFLSVIRVVGGDWIVYRYLFIDFLFQSLCWVVEHTQDASLYRTLYMYIVHLTFYSDRRSSRKVLNKQKPHLDRLQADEILFLLFLAILYLQVIQTRPTPNTSESEFSTANFGNFEWHTDKRTH